MRYIVGLMMFAFLTMGIALVVGAIKTMLVRFKRFHQFEKAEGQVTSLEHKASTFSGGGRVRTQTTWMHLSVVTFTRPSGESVTFTSEVGDAGPHSKFETGQRIGVHYDPTGELPPMIDSFSGMWHRPLTEALGGTAFIGGAIVIYVVFGDQIFGTWALFRGR